MVFYERVIVGAGPAGIAAALKLNDPSTCIVDVGQEATSIFSHANLSEALSHGSVESVLGDKWQFLSSLADSLRQHPKIRASSLEHVMNGEKFEVVGDQGELLVRGRGSYATGGMANVWGGQLLRYTEDDFIEVGDWPLIASDLNPYYTELEACIGISGLADDMHPFLGCSDHLLPPVPNVPAAQHVLKRYASNSYKNKKYRLLIGRPRLAVLTQPYRGRSAHSFGETEFFTPATGGIFNPRDLLAELRGSNRVIYKGGYKLISYEEMSDYVELEIEETKTLERIKIKTKHLLLACGTIQTTKIVLKKEKYFERELPFLDHIPTLLPIFFPACFGLKRPTMSYPIQLIGTLEGIGKRDMISFYYPGGMLWTDLLSNIPLPMNFGRAVLSTLIGGMLVAQIWESSKPSSGNSLQIDSGDGIIINYKDRKKYARIAELLSALSRFGGFSLRRFASMQPPSWGYHHAGTMPMRSNPQRFETHVDGRLWNSKRVRVVDGSIFPSLPAKNHSLTIMANSMRIAALVKLCGY
jgi:choline dehydrogenase-like flavoprotein